MGSCLSWSISLFFSKTVPRCSDPGIYFFFCSVFKVCGLSKVFEFCHFSIFCWSISMSSLIWMYMHRNQQNQYYTYVASGLHSLLVLYKCTTVMQMPSTTHQPVSTFHLRWHCSAQKDPIWSLGGLLKVALETAPTLVKLNTDHSQAQREEH